MSKVIVQAGQTPIDIAMQSTGLPTDIITVANLNGLSMTADLMPGTELTVPEPLAENNKTATALSLPNARPASAIPADTNEGIGFWIIEYDFIVS